MKSILLLLLLSISIGSYAIPKDSLQVEELRKRVLKLEEDNKLLVEKVNIFNVANDKILTAFYTLIGAVIGLLTLVTFWNAFQNWKTNTDRLNNIKDSLYNDLGQTINKRIDMGIDIKVQSLKGNFEKIHYDISGLELKFLKLQISSYNFYDVHPNINIEHYTLERLLGEALKRYNPNIMRGIGDVEDILKAIIAYLEKYPVLNDDEKGSLYSAVQKVPIGQFEIYVNKIKKGLNV